MNHEHYEQLVSQFIDRELDARSENELFLHLSTCDNCRHLLRASWQLQADILRGKPKREVEAARPSPVIPRGRVYPLWVTRISIPLPAAASIVFLLVVASLLFSPIILQGETPRPEVRIEQTLPIPPELQKVLQLHK
ncbi:MAG: zf-HC2 domain-containing protein [Deltaproteobacteria bacterium]|nr:zf-HC2 domain-containing protein [Deltaproteobacteria bacterium]